MPPVPPAFPGTQSDDPPPPFLETYPEKLSRQLKLTLFPLDITSHHELTRGEFASAVKPLIKACSPLATWTDAFMSSTFAKVESLVEGITGDDVGLSMHDPLCVWYVITRDDPGWYVQHEEDIRVETSGQWTRGMCVVDKRNRRRRDADDGEGERPGDTGNWLSPSAGNRLSRCLESPGKNLFAPYFLKTVFRV